MHGTHYPFKILAKFRACKKAKWKESFLTNQADLVIPLTKQGKTGPLELEKDLFTGCVWPIVCHRHWFLHPVVCALSSDMVKCSWMIEISSLVRHRNPFSQHFFWQQQSCSMTMGISLNSMLRFRFLMVAWKKKHYLMKSYEIGKWNKATGYNILFNLMIATQVH